MIRGTERNLVKDIAPTDVHKVEAMLNSSIHNRFDIEVIDAATGEIKQKAQAENVVCNALWTRLLTPANYFNYIHYGTGSGTPASTDTSLFTFLGYGTPAYTDDVIEVQAENGWASYQRKIQLSEVTAVGSTLTEVGIGYSTTAATLCTHAMLKDMNGNTISIAKADTDIINIYATVFVHWTAAGYDSGAVKIIPSINKRNDNTKPLLGFLGMLMGVYASDYNMCTPPTNAQMLNSCSRVNITSRVPTAVTAAYSAVNKTITLTATRLGASANNNGGFLGVVLYGYSNIISDERASLYLKVGGSWYPYSSVVGEAISTGDGETTDFATDFPFPYDATVYVDSVAQSTGVSFGAEPLLYNDMGQYFEGLHEDSTPSLHVPFANPALSSIKYEALRLKTYIYYNPHYSIGIASLYAYYCKVEVSNDLATWTELVAQGSGATVNVNAAYQNYKYWRFSSTDSSAYAQTFTAPSTYVGKPIHFTTAPANGAVITADYKTPVVAKDINHVFDLSVVITLAEHTA